MGLLLDAWLTVLTALWLMLPAYLANMLPVLVGGGAPIDGGRNWKDGQRMLGDGKTWRGLLLAPVLAVLLVGVLRWTTTFPAWGRYGFSDYGPSPWWVLLAYAMALGALVGDALESFFKRRTGRVRGERWVPFDQLDFVAGGLLFVALVSTVLALVGATASNYFLDAFTWPRLLVIVLLTPALHLVVNLIGYKIGAKDVPW